MSGCGQGMKERHVFCQDQSDSGFVAESFCDGLKKPSAWQDCVIECTQDCVVSSWGKWDLDCSRTCGDTLKTRQRVILQQPQGLGRSCPSLVDKQLCYEPACTSFKWKVGIWNTCELGTQGGICGNGTQTREVVCSPDPNREWICEKQAPKPIEFQECSLACPGRTTLVSYVYKMSGRSVSVYTDTNASYEYLCTLIQNGHECCKLLYQTTSNSFQITFKK